MLLIFTDILHPRLHYSCDVIFTRILGIRFSITGNAEEFTNAVGPKINYSHHEFPDSIQIRPSGLMAEKGIRQHQPAVGINEGYPVLYPSEQPAASFPYDIFAAVFYMISRYEEYLPHATDNLGRFPAYESFAYKNGFLEIPVVNIWSLSFAKALKTKYPELSFTPPSYRYLPTIDIDIAFKYKFRSPVRTIGGSFRSLARGDLGECIERFEVLAGQKPDPFDTYKFLVELHTKNRLEALYFLLLADYGGFDKSISPGSPSFANFILGLSTHAALGLHPSFTSNTKEKFLKKEIQYFEQITATKVARTRQHFLMLSVPDTWSVLLRHNIREDYSLGFADLPGFRAGICTPYPFYDLSMENQTNLVIYPLILMDGTLNDYMKLTAEEAIRRSKVLIDRVKAVNGTMISLWHNESLSETGRWKGWAKVYQDLVEYAAS